MLLSLYSTTFNVPIVDTVCGSPASGAKVSFLDIKNVFSPLCRRNCSEHMRF